MYLFLTDEYKGIREESHKLLVKAMTSCGCFKEGEFPELVYSEKGKPSIPAANNSENPSFSVSHTKNYWGVLVSKTPCGFDMQLNVELSYRDLAERIFSEAEADAIMKINSEATSEQQHLFYRIWTMREAYIKAVGGSVFDKLPVSMLTENEVFTSNGVVLNTKDITQQLEIMNIAENYKLYAAVCMIYDAEGIKDKTIDIVTEW